MVGRSDRRAEPRSTKSEAANSLLWPLELPKIPCSAALPGAERERFRAFRAIAARKMRKIPC